MTIFIIILIFFILSQIANSVSNSKRKKTDLQRQEQFRREQISRNVYAEYEKQRQARLLRERQEAELRRRRNEKFHLQKQAEENRLAEQQ